MFAITIVHLIHKFYFPKYLVWDESKQNIALFQKIENILRTVDL